MSLRPALLLALAAALLTAAPASAVTVGISDQQASTFASPLFAPLHTATARYITPWDVMSNDYERGKLDAWITGARAARQRVLLAFEASHTMGRQRHAPSIAEYTAAITAVRDAYPDVTDVQAWNEVNRCQRVLPDGNVLGQPICRNPRRAAQYYMAASRVYAGGRVTGLDVLDENDVRPALRYIRTFLTYAKPRPRYWGIHNYSDTNRFSRKRTRALLAATRTGQVWLTETGGIVQFGRNFPYDEARAGRALGCMFTLARTDRRIKRLYIYNFNGAPEGFSFDSGLVGSTERPAWAGMSCARAAPRPAAPDVRALTGSPEMGTIRRMGVQKERSALRLGPPAVDNPGRHGRHERCPPHDQDGLLGGRYRRRPRPRAAREDGVGGVPAARRGPGQLPGPARLGPRRRHGRLRPRRRLPARRAARRARAGRLPALACR